MLTIRNTINKRLYFKKQFVNFVLNMFAVRANSKLQLVYAAKSFPKLQNTGYRESCECK